MRSNFLSILLTALCFLTIVKDESAAAPLDMSQGELQDIVNEYVSDKEGVLGTIVQIDISGKESLQAALGYFDLSRKRLVAPKDRFIIGSITKTFTATLVLQLVEEGAVEIDGRIIDYFPLDWAEVFSNVKYGDEITVGHLLGHRSGIYNAMTYESFVERVTPDPSRRWSPLEIVRMIPEGEPDFRPGESFKYSNQNYLLLSGLIEHVTGKPYITTLQDKILSAIGLECTFHSEGPFGSSREDVAHGYQSIDGKIYDGQDFDSGWAIASGAMISTTDDLIEFLKALASGRLFKHEETYQQMLQGAEDSRHYGLGIESEESKFGSYVGHIGTFANTSTALRYYPEHGIYICTCLTFDGATRRLKTDELLQVIMSKLLDIEYTPRVWPEDVISYTELDLKIDKIRAIEKYDLKRDAACGYDNKVFTARSENDKLIMVTVIGRTPRSGKLQYSPSCVTLKYKVGNESSTTPCLAVGRIFKTINGTEEHWVTSEEEFEKITRTTTDEDEMLTIYTLFELPKEARDIEVRSLDY